MPPSGSRVKPWLRGHIVPLENDLVNLDLLLVGIPNFKIVSKGTYDMTYDNFIHLETANFNDKCIIAETQTTGRMMPSGSISPPADGYTQ